MSNESEKSKEELIEESITLVCEGSRNVSDLFYLSSDVDARIKFYQEHKDDIGKDKKDWFQKLWIEYLKENKENIFVAWKDWLFLFCFGDMNEDFREKIKRLEQCP